eukprot:UN01078
MSFSLLSQLVLFSLGQCYLVPRGSGGVPGLAEAEDNNMDFGRSVGRDDYGYIFPLLIILIGAIIGSCITVCILQIISICASKTKQSKMDRFIDSV